MYYVTEWTGFLFGLARMNPPGLPLRAVPYTYIGDRDTDHMALEKGGVCWKLPYGLFKASALAIEQLLRDTRSKKLALPGVCEDSITPPGKNDERNKYCYEEMQKPDGKLDAILRAVNAHKGWSKLSKPQSITDAADAYAKKYELRPVRRRKQK
jgi:hypothetical protein